MDWFGSFKLSDNIGFSACIYGSLISIELHFGAVLRCDSMCYCDAACF
jgi:hypothetical protein